MNTNNYKCLGLDQVRTEIVSVIGEAERPSQTQIKQM
jgi:hypothetical protein